MTKIPSFFFPTTVIILDDDKYFSQMLKLSLEEDFHIQTFTDPSEIEPFLGKNAVCMNELARDYLPLSSEGSVKSFLDSGLSHNLVSVWITDYRLEHTTGIDVLEKFNPPLVRRVLMSNFVDQATVNSAFKYKTIHAYLPKLDHEFVEKLKMMIHEMQEQFFNNYWQQINNEPIQQSNNSDHSVVGFFKKILKKFKTTQLSC